MNIITCQRVPDKLVFFFRHGFSIIPLLIFHVISTSVLQKAREKQAFYNLLQNVLGRGIRDILYSICLEQNELLQLESRDRLLKQIE